MRERITRRHLDQLCRVLNTRAGFDPDTPMWKREDGRNVATVGMFYVDGAYGGWALYRIEGEAGSVDDIFRCGHVPARDLDGRIRAFMDGMEYAERA